ncbi:Syntaxin-5 [Lamellibrachia satsuma]|nr:Syntaxin-5 [Lamellibrachia satsuma]
MTTRRRRTNSNSEDKENYPIVNAKGNRTYVSSGTAYEATKSHGLPVDDIDAGMTCRDRTNEFMSAVKSIQTRQGNGLVQNRHKTNALHQQSQFMLVARKIGKDLANTFAKLEKLTILAKRKSLFDDRPQEIQQLIFIVKQDISLLNKQIAQLQELMKSQRYQNGPLKQSHSNTVVVTLQSKLASMSTAFKSVLEVRTENLKQQKTRREHFSESPVSASMPPSALAGHHQGSVLLQDESSSVRNREHAINMDVGDQERYQQQLQLIDEQDSYIANRADTMQNIEQTIVELGGIFQQLAHMVKEQEEVVQRIDSNVEDTFMNVEAAHSEILKYFQSVTSNRWLMIKIFGVLIVFFIIFVVFMA